MSGGKIRFSIIILPRRRRYVVYCTGGRILTSFLVGYHSLLIAHCSLQLIVVHNSEGGHG